MDWKICVADSATNASSAKCAFNNFLHQAELVGQRHLQKNPQTYLGMIWSTVFHSLVFTAEAVCFHLQLCSSSNCWSCLNKLHSNIWTLTCVLLVCLVKLPHNWPSRVRSYKQTLTAECVFDSAFTLTQSLCFLEEQRHSLEYLGTVHTNFSSVKHS